MKIHLVGGFLGSGKTTAIMTAAKEFIRNGKRVGIITNDQGKYLVDTAFFSLNQIPAVEVTGGCFCCNYHQLDDQLELLIETARPDAIFAESVGSCADLVATVMRPMQQIRKMNPENTTFSVFSDSRLLRLRLLDEPLPFSEDVVYIFDKQLEEAGLVVLNKIDLLSNERRDELIGLFRRMYPDKPYIIQNSLDSSQIGDWLAKLEQAKGSDFLQMLDIDYQRYGDGEALLAWVDEEAALSVNPESAQQVVINLIQQILNQLAAQSAGIGHLKIIIQTDSGAEKISFPAIEQPGWEEMIPGSRDGKVRVLINARVEMSAEKLKQLIESAIASQVSQYSIGSTSAFHPQAPHPTYRLSA
jgi:Ni2+-binding GTPase involved in maturation of urease and hydrogenase